MFHKLIYLVGTLILLQSCQAIDTVTAQGEGELTFESRADWDYAARNTPPGMIQQVRQENISSDWIGDPKRFWVIKVQNLGLGQKPFYFIYPGIGCPDTGCNDYHQPLCGSGGCTYLAYIEENGQYRRVFNQLFQAEGSFEEFFKVSRQLKDGLPACIELAGYDARSRYEGKLPQRGENQQFVSRYCYDGNEYVLNRLYLVLRQEFNR